VVGDWRCGGRDGQGVGEGVDMDMVVGDDDGT
jgi:hypothetical protein